MSVINQVLNQLEQRGAHDAPAQTMVRAVPDNQRKTWMNRPWLALGVALVVALAAGVIAWQWIQMRKPKVVAVSAVQQPALVIPVPIEQPVLEIPAQTDQPALVVPVADAAVNSVGEVGTDEVPPTESFIPASRLSFELVSVPLPSSTRLDTGQSMPEGRDTIFAGEPTVKKAPPARSPRPRPAPAASPKAQTAIRPPEDVLPIKQVSPAQYADVEFRKAVALMQRGHITDAIAGYETALRLDAGHDAARQALVALLLESGRSEDAGRILQDRLKDRPEHTGFAMLLARLQVELGLVEQAMATLEKSLPYAEKQADYHAFYAALLQRLNRHKEAISHYQIVLQLAPGSGIWLMGYGISLQAVLREEDAKIAYRRALETKTLSPELQVFVQMKIKEL